MKRKPHRDIPDFSHRRPGNALPTDDERKAPPPRTPVRAGKPQATSAKSGRRGT